jgi:hypothetical protein
VAAKIMAIVRCDKATVSPWYAATACGTSRIQVSRAANQAAKYDNID